MIQLLIYFFAAFAMIPSHGDALVEWEDGISLEQSNFKGQVPRNAAHAALSSIKIDMNYQSNGEGLEFIINCTFDENHSWIKPEGGKNAKLLKHETLHFDIYEVYARKIRKEISSQKPTIAEINSMAKGIFNKYSAELQMEQKRYDKETDHSLIEAEQTKWNAKVAKQLKELEAFKTTKFTIPVQF